jgi:hypothetical protein
MSPFVRRKSKAPGATPRPQVQRPLAQAESSMKMPSNIPHQRNVANGSKFTLTTPAEYKSSLVDLGLYARAHSEWAMVEAITRIIAARGWGYE